MADTDDVNASGTLAPAAAESTLSADLGFILVARYAFADYQVGDEIKDVNLINDILAGELAVYVIKRAA